MNAVRENDLKQVVAYKEFMIEGNGFTTIKKVGDFLLRRFLEHGLRVPVENIFVQEKGNRTDN